MIIADLHNDTAYELFYKKQSLLQNNLHIDLKKQFFSKNLLFFAIYMNPVRYGEDKWGYFYNIYNYLITEIEKNKDKISLFSDTKTFLEGKKHNAILTLEGGDVISHISDILKLKNLGIKLITLTWNNDNKIASCVETQKDKGLSHFGKDIIKEMNKENIFADLSHASDKTFFDVINLTKKPVFVTHSNSRVIFPNKRNITDEMFCALKENGGILGLNFYSEFIGENPDIYDLLSHIEHFLKLKGENNLSFGSDFDGIDSLPDGIFDFTSYKTLYEILEKEFGKIITEKIIYKNVINILK